MHLVTFHARGATFVGYPYPGSSVRRAGFVNWQDVRDADPGAAPPELRLRTGETLAVPAILRKQMRAGIARAEVPNVRRTDIWALLLEPFLDTQFGEEQQQRTLELLKRGGFSADEVDRIRGEVREPVLKYSAVHWDWVHLGLFDLLDACAPSVLQTFLPSRRRESERFYWWAMGIADRGRFGSA